MGENSAISWTDNTFNPWIGCTNVGPGCDHCYAEVFDRRFYGGAEWGPGAPRRRTLPSNWQQPLKWNRKAQQSGTRPRVFSASLADIFDNEVEPKWRDDFFELVAATPNLDWLVVTKRIGNVAKMLGTWDLPPHVMLLSTIVDQDEADRDIPKLLDLKARGLVRRIGISAEPLLGPIAFAAIDRLDWIIVGGESGANARPMHPDWARSIRDQCAKAGVPFHFKQWGEWGFGRLLDGIEHNGYPK